jgi:hypothetical protein
MSENNKQLFNEQVLDHISKLNDLMSMASGATMDDGPMRKASLATKLLEGSTSMLGLEPWSESLSLLRELLEKSYGSRKCWDEQLSQIVSEVLETEEQAVEEILATEAVDSAKLDIFQGLKMEMEVILKECDFTPVEMEQPEDLHIDSNGSLEGFVESFSTLDRLIDSLNGVRDRFSMYLEDPSRRSDIIRNLELAFGESEFFVDLIGDILSRLGDVDRRFLSKVSCATVLDGVKDFFHLHSRIKGWDADFQAKADDCSLDRDVASTLAVILEGCLFDVCKLSGNEEDFKLNVEVEIESKGSYLIGTLSDDLRSFLCDSELDRDDVMAFYPSLKNVRNLLERFGGLIWIEPETENGVRFRFTLPFTMERKEYQIFSASGMNLAFPLHSLVRVLPSSEAIVEMDRRGRHVDLSGERIPLYSLDELAPEEAKSESSREHVMIVGVAEKRAAVYIDDLGNDVDGVIEQVTEGEWSSMMREVLNVGENEYPILDVLLIMKRIRFLQGLDGNLEESGTFVGDEDDVEMPKESTVPRV